MKDVKEIRKQLKEELGYNARMVSVSANYSRIIFTIRDASVNKKAVEEFAIQFSNVHYDHATGEVLCGGNTFTFVRYADSVEKEIKSAMTPAVEKALAQVKDNYLIDVEGTNYMIGNDDGRGITVWESGDSGSFVGRCWNASEAAMMIATR